MFIKMNAEAGKPSGSLHEFRDNANKNHAPTISILSVYASKMTMFDNSEQKKKFQFK